MTEQGLTLQAFVNALLEFQNTQGQPAVRATLNTAAGRELKAAVEGLPKAEVPEGAVIKPMYSLKEVVVAEEQTEPVIFYAE